MLSSRSNGFLGRIYVGGTVDIETSDPNGATLMNKGRNIQFDFYHCCLSIENNNTNTVIEWRWLIWIARRFHDFYFAKLSAVEHSYEFLRYERSAENDHSCPVRITDYAAAAQWHPSS